MPLVWRVVEDDGRRFLIGGFPDGIYYPVEVDCVLIGAERRNRDFCVRQQR